MPGSDFVPNVAVNTSVMYTWTDSITKPYSKNTLPSCSKAQLWSRCLTSSPTYGLSGSRELLRQLYGRCRSWISASARVCAARSISCARVTWGFAFTSAACALSIWAPHAVCTCRGFPSIVSMSSESPASLAAQGVVSSFWTYYSKSVPDGAEYDGVVVSGGGALAWRESPSTLVRRCCSPSRRWHCLHCLSVRKSFFVHDEQIHSSKSLGRLHQCLLGESIQTLAAVISPTCWRSRRGCLRVCCRGCREVAKMDRIVAPGSLAAALRLSPSRRHQMVENSLRKSERQGHAKLTHSLTHSLTRTRFFHAARRRCRLGTRWKKSRASRPQKRLGSKSAAKWLGTRKRE